jgi:hypothetical protein
MQVSVPFPPSRWSSPAPHRGDRSPSPIQSVAPARPAEIVGAGGALEHLIAAAPQDLVVARPAENALETVEDQAGPADACGVLLEVDPIRSRLRSEVEKITTDPI